MNRKLCKKLRAQARARTEGAPNTAYERRRSDGRIQLTDDCTRYAYHRLKAAAKVSA